MRKKAPSKRKFFVATAYFAAAVALCLAPSSAQAENFYNYVQKRQEVKSNSRWSLSEWLATKNRIQMMDMWLAFNSPSPYEFFLGGDYRSSNSTASPKDVSFGYSGAAYASIFGLEGQHRLGANPETQAFFNMRIFGYQAQGTNITLQGGIRWLSGATATDESSRNASLGGSTTIYLGQFFGGDFLYRHHFASVPSTSGSRVSGSEMEFGAFLDFSFLRVYGKYFIDPSLVEGAGSTKSDRNTGFTIGTRIWF